MDYDDAIYRYMLGAQVPTLICLTLTTLYPLITVSNPVIVIPYCARDLHDSYS